MSSGFIKPSEAPSSETRVTDFEGDLIILSPTGEERTVETVHGEADARPVDLIDVATGKKYSDVLIFQKALRAQLARAQAAGSPLVGILGKGEASKSKSAPWLMLDSTDEQLEQARKVWVKMSTPF